MLLSTAVFKSTAAPLTSAIHAAVIFCFLLVVVFGSHSDIPKPCPLGVLDIFDSICESEFGPIEGWSSRPFLADIDNWPMLTLSLFMMISGWLIALIKPLADRGAGSSWACWRAL